MAKIYLSRTGLIFLFIISIAELFQAGILPVWYLTAILISCILFGFGFLLYIRNRNKLTQETILPVRLLIGQWIIYDIYNIWLYVIGVGHTDFFKSSMIQMTFPLIILLGGWGFYYIFKRNALRYFVYSIVINFILVLVYQLFKMGPRNFFGGIMGVFNGISVGNPFETNSDAVFSIGLYFLYLVNQKNFEKPPRKRKLLILLILIILCGKRSQYLALAVLAIFSLLTGFVPEKKLYKFETIASIMMIVTYYGYIYLMDTGILSSFLYDSGINGMGRIQMWSYVAQYFDFSPMFLGHGYSFSTLMLENNRVWTYNGAVYSLHGGVIGFYNDLGFIIFGLWMIINLIVIPKYYRKRYGYHVTNLYWVLTVYLFVLYLTESSINHFITQTLYIVILLHAINLKIVDRCDQSSISLAIR